MTELNPQQLAELAKQMATPQEIYDEFLTLMKMAWEVPFNPFKKPYRPDWASAIGGAVTVLCWAIETHQSSDAPPSFSAGAADIQKQIGKTT